MTTPESVVKKKVKSLLATYGAYQHWPVLNGMGSPTLDCIGCHEGRYFAIETKAPGKKPTERQGRTMNDIQKAKGMCFVVDGDASLELLEWWLKGGV